MHIQTLETWEYQPNGRRRKSEKIIAPVWEQIEAAIRRLDGHEYPILFLWASTDPALQMIDEFSERLEVLGGAEKWWVAGTFRGYFQRRLRNPDGGTEEIELYPPHIELGFGAPARDVTRDITQVLRAAQHYADFGDFDPSLPWA